MFTKRTIAPMTPADRARLLWREFELSLVTPRKEMERQRDTAMKEMDNKWNSIPSKKRGRKDEHEARKAEKRQAIEEEFILAARERWDEKLRGAHLTHEDWHDITPAEQLAVAKALGNGEVDIDTESILETSPHAVALIPPPIAPSLSSGMRSQNISATYALVSPNTFGYDDDGLSEPGSFPKAREIAFEEEAVNIPPPLSITTNGWGVDAPAYSKWSTGFARSSNESSKTSSPEILPAKTLSFDNMYTSSASRFTEEALAPPKRPPDISSKAMVKARLPGSAYIGPQLSDPEESYDEEEDFEKFKMEIRIAKIREFHEAAAKADIDLAIDFYNARKTKRSTKAEDAGRVIEHERLMMALRESKEDERKKVVATERMKRRDDIRRRTAHPEMAQITPIIGAGSQWGGSSDMYDDLELDDETAQMLAREMALGFSNNASYTFQDDDTPTLPSSYMHYEHMQPHYVEPEVAIAPMPAPKPAAKGKQSAWQRRSPEMPLPVVARELVVSHSSDDHLARPAPPADASPPLGSKMKPAPITTTWGKKAALVGPPTPAAPVPPKAKVDQPGKPVDASSSKRQPEPQAPVVTPAPSKQDTSKAEKAKAEKAATVSEIPTTKKEPPPPEPQPKAVPASKKRGKAGKKQAQAQPNTQKAEAPVAVPKAEKPSHVEPPKKQPTPPPPEPEPVEPEIDEYETIDTPTMAELRMHTTLSRLQYEDAPPTPRPSMSQMQSHGVNSSWSTVDQMHQPPKSAISQRELWAPPMRAPWSELDEEPVKPKPVPPPMRPNGREYWVPPSATRDQDARQAWHPPASSRSPSQIEKSTSMPVQRAPPTLDPRRQRRMSDPVSPSPRGFAYAQLPDISKPPDAMLQSILKKTKGKKQGQGKRVTIEEVSDDEEGAVRKGLQLKLPHDSKSIIEDNDYPSSPVLPRGVPERNPYASRNIVEPKPSMLRTAYANVLDYETEEDRNDGWSSSLTTTPSTAPTSPDDLVSSWGEDRMAAALLSMQRGNDHWNNILGNPPDPKHKIWKPAAENVKPVVVNHAKPIIQKPLDSDRLMSALSTYEDPPMPGSFRPRANSQVMGRETWQPQPPQPQLRDVKGKLKVAVDRKGKGKGPSGTQDDPLARLGRDASQGLGMRGKPVSAV